MPLPNFFIIGAMKSGTTSLHSYLATHPDIFMSEPKEPAYFVEEMNLGRGEDWYMNLFAQARGAKIAGESSAVYSMVPKYMGVPERIARFNPEARFVYILRDPFQRTLSHYWHMVQHHGEQRDLVTAIKTHPPYTNVSYYALQIRPYLKIFGRDRLKIVFFEELKRNPLSVVRQLFAWLGLDDDFAPPNLNTVENATPQTVVRKKGAVDRFRHSALWNALGGFIPPFVRRFGKRLLETRVDRSEETVAEARAYLGSIQQAQLNELHDLLGSDFPDWASYRPNSASPAYQSVI